MLPTHRPVRLALAAGAVLALVGLGVAVGTSIGGEDAAGAGSAAGVSSLLDVQCGTNLLDEPAADGDVVNTSDDPQHFRVVVEFRDGDRRVGEASELLDPMAPGAVETWHVSGTKEYRGSALDCDVRVEGASD